MVYEQQKIPGMNKAMDTSIKRFARLYCEASNCILCHQWGIVWLNQFWSSLPALELLPLTCHTSGGGNSNGRKLDQTWSIVGLTFSVHWVAVRKVMPQCFSLFCVFNFLHFCEWGVFCYWCYQFRISLHAKKFWQSSYFCYWILKCGVVYREKWIAG